MKGLEAAPVGAIIVSGLAQLEDHQVSTTAPLCSAKTGLKADNLAHRQSPVSFLWCCIEQSTDKYRSTPLRNVNILSRSNNSFSRKQLRCLIV